VAEEAVLHGVETPVVSGTTDAGERIYVASQWQLMWWRFRKHHLAMAAGIVVVGFYLVAIFADFLATTGPELSDARRSLMPPQRVHWFDGWSLRPHVYAVKGARDPKTFKRVYQVDPTQKIPVSVLAHGFAYKLFGLIPTDRHLLGVGQGYDAAQTLFILGTDVQGRDLWSRLLYATRISVSIGLVGVALSLFLGVLLGGVSGFYGGWIDTLIQRIIEIFRSIPTIPLWMGLAAALPRDWSILQVYFAITIII
jgi:peptide/nickel transport system permease protein